MESIFDSSDNSEIVIRINKLTPNANSAWGKMNAAQMLAHCQIPLRVATGEIKLKRNLLGILFGGYAKKVLTNNEPFKKNLPTDKKFIVKDEKNFDEEKRKLTEMVRGLAENGPSILTKEPHPFFGNLTTEEWNTLMWKHLDHHLRQFGV